MKQHMTYDQAIKVACRLALETNQDAMVCEDEDDCYVSQDEADFGACIYLAEPCYESVILAQA